MFSDLFPHKIIENADSSLSTNEQSTSKLPNIRPLSQIADEKLDDSNDTKENLSYDEVYLTREEIFKAASDYDYMGDNKSYFDQVFTAYIAASYIVFDKNNALPSWKFMSDIHSPAFLFNGTPTEWREKVKYSSVVSPGLCFLLLQKETHNQNTERYYLNLLMIVLRRHYKYKTLDEALDFFINKETDEEVAVILAELICVFSNYCKYMTDKVTNIFTLQNISFHNCFSNIFFIFYMFRCNDVTILYKL
jgi:hypothetical protein